MVDVINVSTGGSASNYLLQNRAVLTIPALPKIELTLRGFNVPGVSNAPVIQTNPGTPIKLVGNQLEFDELGIEFDVSDSLDNWLSIYSWLVSTGKPASSGQYDARLIDYADATLHVFDQSNNETMRFLFKDIIPVRLSELRFDMTITDPQPMVASATFAYTGYVVEKVSGVFANSGVGTDNITS